MLHPNLMDCTVEIMTLLGTWCAAALEGGRDAGEGAG